MSAILPIYIPLMLIGAVVFFACGCIFLGKLLARREKELSELKKQVKSR